MQKTSPVKAKDDYLNPQLKPRTPFQLALKRFLKNKLAISGVIVLFFIVLAAIFAPLLTDHAPTRDVLLIDKQSPSSQHFLGIDATGRDSFSRLSYGARVSLMIGFSVMFLTDTIVVIFASVSGYYGGKIGNIIMRL